MLKTQLREQYLLKRSTLRKEETDLLNAQVCERVSGFVLQKNIRLLHTFLPRPGKQEIDTWQIIRLFWTNNPEISLAAPRVVPGTSGMEHYLLNSETSLLPSRWKIPEPNPETSQPIDPKQIDAVLVPLLAFDRDGFRVGYGGGFYDRFLTECRPDTLKIGLSHFGPVDKIDDVDQFDIPLDICIIPDHLYRF